MEIYDYIISNMLFRGQILMQSYPYITIHLPVNIMKGTQQVILKLHHLSGKLWILDKMISM